MRPSTSNSTLWMPGIEVSVSGELGQTEELLATHRRLVAGVEVDEDPIPGGRGRRGPPRRVRWRCRARARTGPATVRPPARRPPGRRRPARRTTPGSGGGPNRVIQYICTVHGWSPAAGPWTLEARSGSDGLVDDDAVGVEVVPSDTPIATAIATATSTSGTRRPFTAIPSSGRERSAGGRRRVGSRRGFTLRGCHPQAAGRLRCDDGCRAIRDIRGRRRDRAGGSSWSARSTSPTCCETSWAATASSSSRTPTGATARRRRCALGDRARRRARRRRRRDRARRPAGCAGRGVAAGCRERDRDRSSRPTSAAGGAARSGWPERCGRSCPRRATTGRAT